MATLDEDPQFQIGGESFAPDEVVTPTPSEEQNWLWENLENIIDEDSLARAEDFIGLDPDTQALLARAELSHRILEAGKSAGLDAARASVLAAVIRDLFTGRVRKNDVIATLAERLKIAVAAAEAMAKGLDDLVERAGAFKPLEKGRAAALAAAPELATLGREAPLAPSARIAEEAPEAREEAAPFILHEEKPKTESVVDILRGEKRAERSFAFTPKPSAPPQSSETIRAKIEGRETNAEKPKTRVVHYSNLRTPLDDADANNAK